MGVALTATRRDREDLVNAEIDRLQAQATVLKEKDVEADQLRAEIKRLEAQLAEVEGQSKKKR